jgi:hypothetical protein
MTRAYKTKPPRISFPRSRTVVQLFLLVFLLAAGSAVAQQALTDPYDQKIRPCEQKIRPRQEVTAGKSGRDALHYRQRLLRGNVRDYFLT